MKTTTIAYKIVHLRERYLTYYNPQVCAQTPMYSLFPHFPMRGQFRDKRIESGVEADGLTYTPRHGCEPISKLQAGRH